MWPFEVQAMLEAAIVDPRNRARFDQMQGDNSMFIDADAEGEVEDENETEDPEASMMEAVEVAADALNSLLAVWKRRRHAASSAAGVYD